MLQELEIVASELVKIQIEDASVRKYSFPQNLSKIEKGKIVAIQAYNVNNIATTPEGNPVVNAGVFAGSFLTLKEKEKDVQNLNQVPLQDLQRSNNSGVYERIKPLNVDLSQSYVEIANNIVPTAGEFFLFRIMYVPNGKNC